MKFSIPLAAALLTLSVSMNMAGAEPETEINSAADQSDSTADAEAEQEEDSPEVEKDKVEKKGRGNILPIPIFITEPAIGQGLGVVLSYFHPDKQGAGGTSENDGPAQIGTPESIAHSTDTTRKAPPVVTGVAAAYTNKETALVAIGHSNNWRKDGIRYKGALAWANINSTIYVLDLPIDFNLKGGLFYQDLRFRIKDSKIFAGLAFSYLDTEVRFSLGDKDDTPVPEGIFEPDIKDSGIAGRLLYDSLDNQMMPRKGVAADLSLWRYDQSIGGDYDYWKGHAKLISFHQMHEKFVLGWRLDYQAVDGNLPFYAYPWISLRGIAAMRYQGEETLVAELEGRYVFHPRWAAIGFAGKGWTDSDRPTQQTEDNIRAYGVGLSYAVFPDKDVWMGIDIARGPEETYWYIQVGQNW
jgi:hypothetical protein